MSIPERSDDAQGDLHAMVTRLTDTADVTYVLHRYCELVDANRPADIVALFAPGASFDYGHGKIFTGLQQLSTLFGGLDQNEATSHHLSNITVSFDNPGTARSHSYIYAYHRRRADGQLVHLWGRYDDVLIRRTVPGAGGERWAIEHRALRGAAEHGVDPDPGWPSRYELIARTGRGD
jgi:hypothetical protein